MLLAIRMLIYVPQMLIKNVSDVVFLATLSSCSHAVVPAH